MTGWPDNPRFVVVLDESQLSLITQRRGAAVEVDQCKEWLASLVRSGTPVMVPAIAVYELRRELMRVRKTTSLARLEQFLDAEPNRYIALTREALDLASELWAQVRNQGRPTAPDAALDGDAIVAAQALCLGLPTTDFVIATNNTKHLELFAPAKRWQDIAPSI